MAAGDLNKKFGWIWLLIGPLMGLYITGQFNSLGAAYTEALRTPNRLLHAHGALLAILNIVYGMSIDSALLSDKTKRLGSVLAVAGAVLVTLGFLFIQITSLRELVFPFRVLGGIGLVIAIAILAAGQLKKMQ